MTFDEFIKMQKNKKTDDLVSDFLKEVAEITPVCVEFKKNYFIRFEHFEQMTEHFVKIPNSAEFIPQRGDLCVWGSGVCNGKGAAFLATGKGNAKHFYCFETNKHGKMNIKRCNYKYFLGAIRVK